MNSFGNLPAGCQYDERAPWNEVERTDLLPHEIMEIEEECEAVIVSEYGEDWGHNTEAINAYGKLYNKTIKDFFK